MLINEYQARKKRLQQIIKLGINPYPALTKRSINCQEVLDKFEQLEKEQKRLIVAGRLMLLRYHGKINFVLIKDFTSQLQLVFKQDQLKEKDYQLFKLLDIGDFIEVTGTAYKTQKGERSILVTQLKLLTKALRPLPEKWHGLKDPEERLHKRYLDLLTNPSLKELFILKAKFWNTIREFLLNYGFIEIETPVLEVTTGGADAKPFKTYHQALDLDVYLRISAGELWQKELMVAGFEKTFEIGRVFRNEGMDTEHLQDYTQMEFYWAYADYRAGMKLVEEMFKYTIKKVFNTLKFNLKNFNLNLDTNWQQYDYQQIVKESTGIDVIKTNLKEITKKLNELGIKYDKKSYNLTRAIDNLWKYCRKKIAGPGFLVNVPVIVSPLAKSLPEKPGLTQRFQVIIAGSELGNGYSELNDPNEQAQRFKEQNKLRQAGDEEAQMYAHNFVEALEHGMPPTCGFGISERVFSFFAGKPIRECQLFPLVKPKH